MAPNGKIVQWLLLAGSAGSAMPPESGHWA